MSALVISHRTNMGTVPENTLAGIDAAIAAGADAVEIDVQATTDGVPVLLHDPSLERTTGDPREVQEISSAELAALRVLDPFDVVGPQSVPTLAEVLALINGRCTLAIEVKQTRIEQLLKAVVRDAGASRWCWTWAFDPWVASACAEALPEVPASLLVSQRSAERFGLADPVALAHDAGLAGVSLEQSLVTSEAVRNAHSHGLAVYTWTVNERIDIGRVLEAGVDGVCGNYPERIIEAKAAAR